MMIAHLVLDTGILSLSVFTDEDGVDVVVRGLETLNGHTRTDVGEEVEGTTEGEVERDVSLADCSNKRVNVMWRLCSCRWY